MSVLSTDPETTRRPSGKTATLWTYREDRSQKSRRWTSRRTLCKCPVSVATHFPVATSHTLRVLSFDPETTRRPSGNTATHSIYIKDTSPKKKGGHCAPHFSRVPFQRRHAFTGRYIPQLETLVERRRNDVPPVWKDRNAADLRRSHITKVQIVDTAQRTFSECPFSVFTHFPVATSHTLSVLSPDAETTRRPSGNTATPWTYNENRSSQKYHKKYMPRAARKPNAHLGSSRTCLLLLPTP